MMIMMMTLMMIGDIGGVVGVCGQAESWHHLQVSIVLNGLLSIQLILIVCSSVAYRQCFLNFSVSLPARALTDCIQWATIL